MLINKGDTKKLSRCCKTEQNRLQQLISLSVSQSADKPIRVARHFSHGTRESESKTSPTHTKKGETTCLLSAIATATSSFPGGGRSCHDILFVATSNWKRVKGAINNAAGHDNGAPKPKPNANGRSNETSQYENPGEPWPSVRPSV